MTTAIATMTTRVCDVPIDLDENYEREGDVTIMATIHQNSDSSAACSGSTSGSGEEEDCPCPSSWSSSSGSFYDDLETSPIDMGAKWYWHSTEDDNNNDLGQGGGYLSQSTGFEDDRAKNVKFEPSSCMGGSNAQVCNSV